MTNTNDYDVANTNCTNCTNKDPANPNEESARFVEFGRFVFEKENTPCSWQPISDRIVNSLWAEMSQVTRVVKQDIYTIIESDYVPLFNPFKAYFANLPTKRQPSKNPDEGFDAPSTLMSERRAGAFYIPSTMRGEGLGESGGALLQGKEGRGGFRRIIFLISIFEKNENKKLQQTRACNALLPRPAATRCTGPTEAVDTPLPASQRADGQMLDGQKQQVLFQASGGTHRQIPRRTMISHKKVRRILPLVTHRTLSVIAPCGKWYLCTVKQTITH